MEKPSKCISETEARALYNNWNSRASLIDKDLGSDVRDFVFSVEELEEYLAYVKKNHTGTSEPGIRIYFAAYDDSKSKQNTVFLAPTNGVKADSPNNYSIDSLNTVGGGWPPNIY